MHHAFEWQDYSCSMGKSYAVLLTVAAVQTDTQRTQGYRFITVAHGQATFPVHKYYFLFHEFLYDFYFLFPVRVPRVCMCSHPFLIRTGMQKSYLSVRNNLIKQYIGATSKEIQRLFEHKYG